MVTPEMGQMPPAGAWFAIDNGCFAHPERFDMDKYARFCERLLARQGERCLFVVTPDKPYDADETLRRFDLYAERVRGFGAPVAFATQDGMGSEDIPWSDTDALFVGGTTEWKLGHESAQLIHGARARGMWIHIARVNSWRRFRKARSVGAHSADGTLLKHGFDYNWPRLKAWLDDEQAVMVL